MTTQMISPTQRKNCHKMIIPHRGSLCRIHMDIDNSDTSTSYNQPMSFIYAINIITNFTTATSGANEGHDINSGVNDNKCQYQLRFHPDHYKFMEDIFTILDTESRGYVTKCQLEEFVLLRCPVLKRRDDILKAFGSRSGNEDNENEEKRLYSNECKQEGDDSNNDILITDPVLERQHDDDIFNCILGENFQSADDECFLDDDDEREGNNNITNDMNCPTSIPTNDETKNKKTIGLGSVPQSSQTFDEIWNAVIDCSIDDIIQTENSPIYIGIEAWMVFCRFISLAQYQDAKRWFSARHLQQEMPHKSASSSSSSGDSNEVILVDVPPIERPIPILAQHLIEYELLTLKSEANTKSAGNVGIPLPELDVDHSHLFIHDSATHQNKQSVQISVFGNLHSPLSTSSSPDGLEFVIKLTNEAASPEGEKSPAHSNKPLPSSNENIIVRRSFADMFWLHNTFESQKQLGGTLCGRIIPPFPSPSTSSRPLSYDDDSVSKIRTTVSVASASAVMVSSAAKSAKSFLGRLAISTSSSNSLKTSSKKKPSTFMDRKTLTSVTQRSSSFRKNYATLKDKILDNPASKSKQIERYLNYMLNHPSMSTSFPLNVVLKASQSGVESAKRIVETKEKSDCDSNNIMNNSPADETRRSFEKYGITGNLSWVRTAAQAALALKLHGILETTGYQSVSAKLQHASLPKFSNVGTYSAGDDEKARSEVSHRKELIEDTDVGFEEGIVCVESNLDDDSQYDDRGHGYDMLPSPLPLVERSALCAGSVLPTGLVDEQIEVQKPNSSSNKLTTKVNQIGVRYSDVSSNIDAESVALGDVSVDRDIGKLRDIIVTVDKSLGRCLESGLCVGAESSEKIDHQLDFLKTIDGGEGWRGRIISQRVLLSTVESLEMIRNASITNTNIFVSETSWSASLASSAVVAADEVHEVVKASRTASNAKKAAETAAREAQQICQENQFSTMEEARQAQVRASKLRSQAIHAAVVEYEAVTAKRQAAVALARDVKCWNVHRKQQLARTCLKFVKSHQKIAQESLHTWEELYSNLSQTSSISNIVNSSVQPFENVKSLTPNDQVLSSYQTQDFSHEEEMMKSQISNTKVPSYHTQELNYKEENVRSQTLHTQAPSYQSQEFSFEAEKEVRVSAESTNELFINNNINEYDSSMRLSETSNSDSNFDVEIQVTQPDTASGCKEIVDGALSSYSPIVESSFHDTFEEDIPTLNEMSIKESEQEPSSNLNQFDSVNKVTDPKSENMLSAVIEERDLAIAEDDIICFPKNGLHCENEQYLQSSVSDGAEIVNSRNDYLLGKNEGNELNNEVEVSSDDGMTGSMQSLVDGLMNWGGQWDQEEDTPLPDGMAASFLEEKGILDFQ